MVKNLVLFKKGLVIGILVLLVMSSFMPISVSLILKKQVSTDNEIPGITGNNLGNIYYVGGTGEGNYSKLQDAIDDASDGDTVFVYDDSSPYYENIWINVSLNLIGEDKNSTIIDGQNKTGYDTVDVRAHYVNISGFTIQHCGTLVGDAGIQISKNYCTIKDNIITFNEDNGIDLYYGNYNTISGNLITQNHGDWYHGICLLSSNNNIFVDNNISNNGYGFSMHYSNNNIIKNNIINDNYNQDGNFGAGIWSQECNNVTIIHNNISHNYGRGIDLYKSHYWTIYNNTIVGNGWGTLQGTVGADGICLRVGSKNNLVKRNIIKGNKYDGISFHDGSGDTINNLIIENTIKDNDRRGIEYGGTGTLNNIIYHNNLVNNSENNGYDKGTNIWNNTYPIGGNYWDDYNGLDDDGDGLGDEPYFIAEGDNKDCYPLINKWGENAPYADFSYSGINLTVTFDASVSFDRDGTITSYDWKFPDGTTGIGKIINHTFPSYDTYTVYLTVTDDDGRNHTISKIVVVEFNYAPDTPNIPYGLTLVQVNESEMYSTSTSDPNDDMVQFRCDLDANGSHNYSEWSSFVSPGETANISLIWNSGGIYVVKAQASDEHGFLSNWSDGLIVLVNIPPVQPFDPEPEDGDVYVDINADLSWSCSDPEGSSLTYNVFFEKNDETPDEMVSENQTEASFDPGTMAYGTMYYWQIVAWDNYNGSTASPVWYFKTMIESNDPPYVPGDPIPENGEIDVDNEIILEWTGGDPDEDDTVFYDVYLEADNPDPYVKVADDIVEACFDPGLLEPGTVYFWKIVARDNHFASTDGPVWHFTTEENNPPNAPSINGPDRGKPETQYDYGFTSVDPDGHDIAEYVISWGDSTGEETIIGPFASGEEVTGSHSWISDETFTIKAKAKDVYGTESNWTSFDIKIEIPRNRATYNFLFNWLFERFPLLGRLLNLLKK